MFLPMGVCDLGQICGYLVSGLKARFQKPAHERSTKVEDHRHTEVFLMFLSKSTGRTGSCRKEV